MGFGKKSMKSTKEKVSEDDECTVNSSVSVWPVIAACLLKCWHMKNSELNKAAVRQSGMSCFLSMLSFSIALCFPRGGGRITWEQSAGDAGHLQSITRRPALSTRSDLMCQKQRFPHTD